ncbi:MAG TPA: hypothetical protein VFU41_11135 [Gemmatimonadales bacterium]|nr:hypothetical protein [Gemmatimonadales bacterium]
MRVHPGTADACLAAGLALVAAPGTGTAQCRAAATIDTVVIESAGVSGGGLTAALHIPTRPGVIRRTMFVRAGDCYDSARVAESERALWELGVFRAVRLDTVRLGPDGLLALRVATADGWSARPVADYTRIGSHTTWEAGVFDANFLGTASQLFASYRSTPDRGAVALQYSTRHLGFPGSIVWARYARLSNGRHAAWLVGLPFREAAARHSATLDGEAVEERVLIFGERTSEAGSRARAVRLRATIAYAPHATSRGFVRLWAGARWRQEGWSATATDPYIVGTSATAGAGLELATIRFRTTRRLNTYGRPEYVDLSPAVRVGVWAAPQAWGYPAERAGVGIELRSRVGAQWPAGHAALQLDAWGGYAAGALDSGQARARVTVVTGRGGHTLIVHGEAGRMLGLRPPGAYDLWFEQRGPRLFAPHAFIGSSIWWTLVEDRVVVRESLAGLLGVGVAPFVEYARARDATGREAAGGNAGLAVRLVPLRFAASDVTELAMGYRFGSATPRSGWGLGVRKGFWF